MSLTLVQLGLTGAAMFGPSGGVLHPSEILPKRAVAAERGSPRHYEHGKPNETVRSSWPKPHCFHRSENLILSKSRVALCARIRVSIPIRPEYHALLGVVLASNTGTESKVTS
jgi:hypothetical protein